MSLKSNARWLQKQVDWKYTRCLYFTKENMQTAIWNAEANRSDRRVELLKLAHNAGAKPKENSDASTRTGEEDREA